MTAGVDIVRVRSADDAAAVHDLAWRFIGWLRERYPDMEREIDDYLEAQKFGQEIRDVRTTYGPPTGECLLARADGQPVGILMLKDIGDGVCEMNRMYVADEARGRGVGRKLVSALVDRARQMGFDRMTLSALPRHHEALALYRSLGFIDDDREIEAGNTAKAVFMRLEL